MAVAIRNCLGVDIGTHSIRVAQMEMGKGGPRVVALLEERIKTEAGHSEAQRNQAIAKQLQDLLKRGRVGTKNAVFCVPGQSVFVRRIKLPKTTEERMARIIRFEARQQIPFPLDKTIMEYQIFEEGDSSEVNVLLVAIKRDFILNFMKMVRRTGLKALAISVSSLALYNFNELNGSTRDLLAKPDKAKPAAKEKGAKEPKAAKGGLFGLLKKGDKNAKPQAAAAVAPLEDDELAMEDMGFEEIQAYVNVGASLMDLAIPKPGGARMIGFTRSVPLAGNEMDRAVRDKLGLDDLAQACRLKEQEAGVMSTEFEMEADAESLNMEASEAVTQVADRLISELRRSLDFYISQPDGVAVDSIVLSGGLAKLRYLASYIEEKMGLPVALAEPRNAQLRLPDPLPADFSAFAVAMGLGLQGLQVAQNKINFLPEELKNVRSVQERPWELVGMGAMLLGIIGLSFVSVGSGYTTQYKRQVESMNSKVQEASQWNSKITEAETQRKNVATAYEKLAKATTLRDFMLLVARLFVERLPAEVLVDEIQLRLDGTVVVRGKSPSQYAVSSQLLKGLEELKGGIFAVQVNSMNQVRDPRFAVPSVYDYTITLKTFMRRARIRSLGEQPARRNQMGQLVDERGQPLLTSGFAQPMAPAPTYPVR